MELFVFELSDQLSSNSVTVVELLFRIKSRLDVVEFDLSAAFGLFGELFCKLFGCGLAGIAATLFRPFRSFTVKLAFGLPAISQFLALLLR